MKYFLDTEFIESGWEHPITLLSLAIVAEDGRELYIVAGDADLRYASQWVAENVLPHLQPDDIPHVLTVHQWERAQRIRRFIGDDPKPEFWGYYADYDWVVFCQIFGAMIDLPKGWPKYCRDIKQWCADLGDPKLPEQTATEHNALHDARWNKQAWEFLNEIVAKRNG